MTITLSALQKQRYDTAANWTAENPTLLAGEIGVESDTGKIKIGTGSTVWTSLSYSGLIPGSGVYPYSQLLMPSGTAGAPSISFDGDANTGIYRSGTDALAISTNGTGRLFVDASGNIECRSYASIGTLAFANANGTEASPTALSTPQLIMNLVARGYDGSAYRQIAAVRAYNDGAVSSTSSPGFLALSTTPSGSTTAQERLRITSAGLVGMGVSSPSWPLDVNGVARSTGTSAMFALSDRSTGTGDRYGIYSNSNTFRVYDFTAAADRVVVDSSGRVGIGTTSVQQALHVSQSGGNNFAGIRSQNRNTGTGTAGIEFSSDATYAKAAIALRRENPNGAGPLVFYNSASTGAADWSTADEKMRLTPSGQLLVGTSSASAADATIIAQGNAQNSTFGSRLYLARGEATPADGAGLGHLNFSDSTHTVSAMIRAVRDGGTWSGSSKPTRLEFSTTADGASSPTERMRITSGGALRFGQTTTDYPGSGNTTTGIALTAGGRSGFSQDGDFALLVNRNTSDGNVVQINRQGSGVGSISVTTTATAYNTSSDYRLKENVTPVINGIARLQQLKPSRFNFIADPDKTVDGFLAHEVQTIVPEAITGEKDAVDADGKPIYQGIDQSKLVPLLTAALQEAIGEIESLKARVAALESA